VVILWKQEFVAIINLKKKKKELIKNNFFVFYLLRRRYLRSKQTEQRKANIDVWEEIEL